MRPSVYFALLLTTLVVAACTVDGPFARFLPLNQGGVGPSPSPGVPCDTVSTIPAAIFHVGFTSPASAGATVSLEPWVFLPAPIMKHDEVLPETFKATVDEAAKEIVVSGQVRATRANPAAGCAYPAIYLFPKAATLSLPVVLPATGTYTVRIASESFTSQRPDEVENPSQPPKVYPEAMATRSLVID